ncbi:MAG: carbon monoxide dehydrogenase [Acetatifactor sp.]|nr:carbon monoxide dehydrogenase [Acetatifactor sp.]
MHLYDNLIQESLNLVNEAVLRPLPLADGQSLWEAEREQRLIFQKDMAYELGGSGLPAVSALAFTSQPAEADRLLLYGPDLPQLHADTPYARLTILHIDDRDWSSDQQAYQFLRRMEYTRYHVYPQGFMMRISTSAGREPVRVSRKALQKGLDFAQVGQLFLNAYHKHPQVQAATLLFVTAPDFPYERLAQKAAKMEAVTSSLDQIFNHLVMDCYSCSLKPVCDEVEGLRELHFSRQQNTFS